METTPNNSSSFIEKVNLIDGFKHNPFSISQLCDKDFKVIFEPSHCIVQDSNTNKVSFIGRRIDNVYVTNLNNVSLTSIKCLTSLSDESRLWNKRLGHVNMHLISNLSKNNLVINLPKINFENNHLCDVYRKGK